MKVPWHSIATELTAVMAAALIFAWLQRSTPELRQWLKATP